jgi:hypothetical protein
LHGGGGGGGYYGGAAVDLGASVALIAVVFPEVVAVAVPHGLKSVPSKSRIIAEVRHWVTARL